MAAPENGLKAALGAGRVMAGPFLSLGSEAVADIAGRAGYDYVLIDAEHGPYRPQVDHGPVAGARGHGDTRGGPCARPCRLGAETGAGRWGAVHHGPDGRHREQARAIASACRFPPEGRRGNGGANTRAGGFGALTDYTATANSQIFLIAQIEGRLAMDNIEAIAAVDGIDALFIGPADLGGDMGMRDDLGAAPLWDAVEDGVARIAATGKVSGVFAGPDRAARMIDAGARLLGTGSDAGLLTAAMRAHAGAVE
jgi:4-hydroxy-2-oxoheptanedioate aldolase